MNPKPSDGLLLERYKLAYAEYRAEVLLGTDRQKLFISLNPVIAALAASARTELVDGALLLAAAASAVGILLVGRSHTRYRQTRDVLLALARQLDAADDWQTTGGMREQRGEPRWGDTWRVTTAIRVLLTLYVLFDLSAYLLLRSGPQRLERDCGAQLQNYQQR